MTTDEVLALAALVLFLVVSLWLGLTRQNPRGRNGIATAPPAPAAFLERTAFLRLPLQSPEQDRLSAMIEAHLARRDDGYRALPQVALAALVQPVPSGHVGRDAAACAALAARRLDIAILDARGHLVAAVLFGPPDDITQTALDRVDVPLVILSPSDGDPAARLDAILGPTPGLRTG